MNLLLVLEGESYRSGSQSSRERGTKNYLEKQFFASKSHINLINKLKTKFNIDTDVFIETYKLNEHDDKLLTDFYLKNSNVCHSIINDNLFPSETLFLNNVYDNTNELIKKKNYDFILFIRIDLYLKKYFIENIDFDKNKIKFAHIDSNFYQAKGKDVDTLILAKINKIFGICQQIMLYPNKFFDVLKNKIIYNATHGIFNCLTANNINRKNIGFFVSSLHICSTDLGWNPIYIQVGRKYNCEYNLLLIAQETIQYVYDDEDVFVFNDKIIDYWKNYIVNEEIIENKEILLHLNANL